MVSKEVPSSVKKKIGIGKSFGLGFVQILGILGDISVSKLFRIERIRYRKKYWIRYRKNLVSEKSFGFGFVQILGIVTHWFEYEISGGTNAVHDLQPALPLDADATGQHHLI